MHARTKKVLGQVGLVVATSLVTATLMGGGVADAFNVPNNSVNSAKIVDNSVTGADIRNRSITGVDVNRTSLGVPRVQAFVKGTSTVGEYTVSHAVGIASVTNPEQGVYCVTPRPSINIQNRIPTVGMEFINTGAYDTNVGWDSVRTGSLLCPNGFAVMGWGPPDERRNYVAFTITLA